MVFVQSKLSVAQTQLIQFCAKVWYVSQQGCVPDELKVTRVKRIYKGCIKMTFPTMNQFLLYWSVKKNLYKYMLQTMI